VWRAEFADPRLVAVYDAEHVWGWEHDFFMSVLAERISPRVLHFGCGTGRLAIAMAEAGHQVTAVDLSGPALDAARRKPGAARVRWVEGTAEMLPARRYETVLLTDHVAQSFVGDDVWSSTLSRLRRALVPGGRLILDSRDPAFEWWASWNPVESRRTVVLPDARTVDAWDEVTEADGLTVTVMHHYAFTDGERLTSSGTVRFRTEAELRSTVESAAFDVDRIYGGWAREPVGLSADGELLLISVARPQRTA
jgi:2-polyprenyl-3-methyl-5-hydroxy-6-metoxy-1,4-benzoquinol methylase